MNNPHASWASVYDLVYQRSFGAFYESLTNATVEKIKELVRLPSRIVDFGAGTGRLSIPLSACGFEVLAVEPCEEMLDELVRKPGGESVSIFKGTMEAFRTDTPFDMAICVFTVWSYVTDEPSLRRSIGAVSDALRPGGLCLIDIPQRILFQDFQCNTQAMQRDVRVTPNNDDLYSYEERTSLNHNGETHYFHDSFQIRYWDEGFVRSIFSEYDFSTVEDLSGEFAATGSSYFLMKKRAGDD